MNSNLREVYVIGIGQTKFTRQPQFSGIDLGVQAALESIKDAGIDPRKFQVAYGARIEDSHLAIQECMQRIGVHSIECANVENACATGGAAIRSLWKDIAYGVHDVGIAVGIESLSTSALAGKLLPSGSENYLDLLGFTTISSFALVANLLRETRGLTIEDLAYPAFKNRNAAVFNPYAHYRKPVTMEEIVNSEVIATPITKLMCCPMSDGAASVIMCTKEIAMQYTTKLIRMNSCDIMSGRFKVFGETSEIDSNLPMLSKKAYENSRVGPMDLNYVEMHDAFSPEEIYTYENLGLCKKYESAKLIRSGDLGIGGRCPVNLSGGLMSLGHPLGASGVRVVCDVTRQLRGEAPAEVQIKNHRAGMAEMVGGEIGRLSPESLFISILTA